MSIRILLIEDHPDTATRLMEEFVAAAFDVVHVATGEHGLRLFQADLFDAVVLDHHLPSITGLEVLVELRRRRPDVPVIFITATGRPEITAEAQRVGAFACVEKHLRFPPIVVERVRDALAGRSIRAAMPRVMRPVFVGREAETALLAEVLDDVERGRGRMVCIVGESGIGKSTLARRLADVARERGCVPLVGRCGALEGAPAYEPWLLISDGLRAWLCANPTSIDPGDHAAYLERLVPHLVSEDPERWAGALLLSSAAKLQRYDKVLHLMRELSAQRPLILMFDDAHAIDSGSLEFLEFVAGRLADARLMVIATCRTDGEPEHERTVEEVLRVARDVDGLVIDMQPFTPVEVGAFVTAATGWQPDEPTIAALFEKTEGHPLFTVEVVRLLVAARRLGTLPAAELGGAVPPTKLRAVKERLRFLAAPHRELLAVAALIGRQFDLAILRGAAGPLADRLDEALADAVVHGVLSGEPPELRFAYDLMRDVLIEELPKAARAQAHARIGEAIERQHARDLQPHVPKLARHFLEAARFGDPRRGIEYAVQAGDRQAWLMAYPEAAGFYDAALRADARSHVLGPGRRCTLLLKLADVHWHAGDFPAARAAGRDAMGAARALEDGELVARAALAFAGQLPAFVSVAGDDDVIAALEEARARLDDVSALKPAVVTRLAEERLWSSPASEVSELVSEARRLITLAGDADLELVARRIEQWAPKPDLRRTYARDAIALGRRNKDRSIELDGVFLGVWSALEYGDIDEVWQHLHACTTLTRGRRHYVWLATLTKAAVAIANSQFAEARALAEEARWLGQELGSPNATLFFGVQWGHLEWLSGRFDRVLELLDPMIETFPGLRNTVRASRAVTLSEAGRLEEARAELEQMAANGLGSIPRNLTWTMNMAYLAEVAARVGHVEHAATLYAQLKPFEDSHVIVPPMFSYGPVAHQLGNLAATLGRLDEAERHYRAALEREHRMRSEHWIARTKVAYAEVLVRLGRRGAAEQAIALREEARACAVRLELPSLVLRCDGSQGIASDVHHCVFRPDGNGWLVGDGVAVHHVENVIGMRYYYELLSHPGRWISCEVLASLVRGGVLVVQRAGDAAVDASGRRRYHARLRELQAERAEAEAHNDLGRLDRIDRESQAIEDQLTKGKRPQLGDTSKKLRPAVAHALDVAYDKICAKVAALAEHLLLSVHRGTECAYFPSERWTFEL